MHTAAPGCTKSSAFITDKRDVRFPACISLRRSSVDTTTRANAINSLPHLQSVGLCVARAVYELGCRCLRRFIGAACNGFSVFPFSCDTYSPGDLPHQVARPRLDRVISSCTSSRAPSFPSSPSEKVEYYGAGGRYLSILHGTSAGSNATHSATHKRRCCEMHDTRSCFYLAK